MSRVYKNYYFRKSKFKKFNSMKKAYFILALGAIFVLGSANSCNDKTDKTVASKEVSAVADDTKEVATEVVKEAEKETSVVDDGERVQFIVTTSMGTMKGELYNSTPQHRDNFVKLANDGFYDELLFHRVIKDFMVQGGDPDSKGAEAGKRLGSGGPGYTVPAEFNANNIHKKGALSAARRGGPSNPGKASSGSQFYIVHGKKSSDPELNQLQARINSQKMMPTEFAYTEAQREIYKTLGGTPFLDMDYTVFGEITEGLDIIDKIAAVETAPGDRPVTDVTFKVEIVK